MSTGGWILLGVLIFVVLWFLWYSISVLNRMSAPREIIKMTPSQMNTRFSSMKTVNGRLVPTGDWRKTIPPGLLDYYDRTGGIPR